MEDHSLKGVTSRLDVLVGHLRQELPAKYSEALALQPCIGEMEKRVVDEDLENPSSRTYYVQDTCCGKTQLPGS